MIWRKRNDFFVMLTSKSNRTAHETIFQFDRSRKSLSACLQCHILTIRCQATTTGQGIDSVWNIWSFFSSLSLVFPNDQTSDNGIKHALTLLAMMAMLMMRYRSLSSQILEASLLLLSLLSVCSTFITTMPGELQMDWWHIHLEKKTLHDGVE